MPTCSRCAALSAALALLVFAGCDTNNPSRDLATVEGRYSVAELTFDPQATALNEVDVAASLNGAETSLRIFGNDEESLFVIEPIGGGSLRIDLRTSVSRGRVTFEAVTQEDEDDLAEFLLPPEFTLEFEGERPAALEATLTRRDVNLEAYDADRYQGLRNTSGQLRVRFERL